MKLHVLLGLATLGVAACSPAAPAPTPAPTPTPTPAPAATPSAPTPAPAPAPAAPVVREAPRDWQLLDATADQIPGIAAKRAERELLADRQPQRTVVVAIIDSGVDTAHVDLRANLWRNEGEIPGNGRDDDGNGYVDDVHGWSFLGGADGRDVHQDTYEVTRLYVRCTRGPQYGPADTLPTALRQRCPEIEQTFQTKRQEATQTLQQIRTIAQTYGTVQQILRQALGTDSLTVARVQAMRPQGAREQQAQAIYLQLAANGLDDAELREARAAYESQVEYGYNPDFDPRAIVGDTYTNTGERRYGNANVTGPDAGHGTHVAGIIGAVRGNGEGIDGIAPAVRLMALRAVPDGDERDKDIANAIRYAADEGAHIVNMSFGKAWSPQKPAVDSAVRYALSKGVLLVHAAGNDAADLATEANFPTPAYANGERAGAWIEVGASSWRGLDSLAAPFSNYGQAQVDVFAPGEDILSTVPGNAYERESGTSMAAPVVSGLAAMLMAYFPSLSATDVKQIILESAARYADRPVVRPGGEESVPFGTLSATGGVVNAYAAIRLAEQRSRVQP